MPKLIICLDFDGTIHQYTRPWTNETEILDDVVPGFFEWANEAYKTFDLVIYSARSKTEVGIEAMRQWLLEQANLWMLDTGKRIEFSWRFAHEKPKAFLTIDDRAIQFQGSWSDLDPAKLLQFQPWNQEARDAIRMVPDANN